ncbi:MAG: SPW repeat protein [Bauldia sp.]
MANVRWQMWLSALAGLMVFVAPWVLGNDATTVAASVSDLANWNLWIAGGAVVVLALAAILSYRPWEEWVSVLIGAWLVASPWVFGFTAATVLAWTVWVAGGVLVVLGLWALGANIDTRRYA